jgi:hypothetical protein
MKWRGIFVLFFVVAADSCGPRADLRVRQRLLPSPSTDCLALSLSRSPDVILPPRLERIAGSDIVWVLVHDSTAENGQRIVSVARSTRPESEGKVELTFVWTGAHRPAKTEEYAVIRLGNRLLTRLRRACAPLTPTPIECDYGDRRAWQCGQTDADSGSVR